MLFLDMTEANILVKSFLTMVEILIITQSIGKIYIRKSMISSIKKIENGEISYDEDYKATGPFTTRYYFTNNALPIKKNENYAMINLFGPEIQLSVTNSTSVGIMASWIASPIGVVLKQQLLSKNTFHLSLGTIMGDLRLHRTRKYFWRITLANRYFLRSIN